MKKSYICLYIYKTSVDHIHEPLVPCHRKSMYDVQCQCTTAQFIYGTLSNLALAKQLGILLSKVLVTPDKNLKS